MTADTRTAAKLPDPRCTRHPRSLPRVVRWRLAPALALLLAAPAAAQADALAAPVPQGVPSEARSEQPEIPVHFRGEALFSVRAPVGELAPGERVLAIEKRLLDAAALPEEALDALRIDHQLASADLHIGDQLIVSVQDVDAHPLGRSRQQLAADYERVVRAALVREFSSRSARGLAIGSLSTLLATAVFALLVYSLLKLQRSLERVLPRFVRRRIGPIRFRQLELVPAEQLERASRSTLRTGIGIGVVVLLYFYLELTLGFFPWTRGLAEDLVVLGRGALGWIASGIWTYLPNLFYVAIITVLTSFALRATRFVFREIDRGRLALPGFYPEWAIPTYKIVRVLAIALATVIAFPYLPGSDSPGFRGVSVFLGVLLSLGSVSAVGNAVAGVVLTYMRAFHVGDRVRIANTTGDVLSTDLLTVRVRTIKNVEVTLPNSAVLANHIENYSAVARTRGLILHTEVTISYAVPWRRVHELLLAAAQKVEGILKEPAPFVLQTKLDDFYVHYELNAHTALPSQMAQLYARLHEEIQDAFHAAGVEIMSPHYGAVRDGNRIEIPDENLPASYEPGALRIARVLTAPGASRE